MDIFRIRKNEIAVFIIGFIILALLNIMMLGYSHDLFTRGGNIGFWSIFYGHFTISGYDSFVYLSLSRWKIYYTLSRHPLIAPMLYPLALLNGWLMDLTGVNCAIYIVAALYCLLGTYSFLFTYRIMRKVIGICVLDSMLCTLFFFSLGHVMTATFVPDHFAISLFLITLTAYIAGTYMRRQSLMPAWLTALLATITCGVTLTNVAKTWLAALWTNGRHFWRLKSLLLTTILPLMIIAGGYFLQYEYLAKPDNLVQQHNIEKKLKKDAKFAKQYYEHKKWMENRRSFNNTDNTILQWIDTKTNRIATIIENLFGESFQLHQDHLLDDTNKSRPVIVTYRHWYNYLIEAIIVALFIGGIIIGRKNKFCLMTLSWFAVDMTMHIILGFALTEVYIMTSHWALALPVAIASLLSAYKEKQRIALRLVLFAVTIWLLAWNIPLVIEKVWNV